MRSWRELIGRLASTLVWIYVAALLGTWTVITLGGDRWWLATVVLFGPRWICGLPLVILTPAVLIRRRLLWAFLMATAIFLGPLMGFCIPWARLVTADKPALRVLSCNVQDHRPVIADVAWDATTRFPPARQSG